MRQAPAPLREEASLVLLHESKCGADSRTEEQTVNHAEQQHAHVTAERIEDIFASRNSVDLYNDVVKKGTEWPTRDYSIKTLAQYLDFKWKDPHPSGAASIEWVYRWSESGDPKIRERILEYNEDDCRATRVLLDGIRELSSTALPKTKS